MMQQNERKLLSWYWGGDGPILAVAAPIFLNTVSA